MPTRQKISQKANKRSGKSRGSLSSQQMKVTIPHRNAPDFQAKVMLLQRTVGNQATQKLLQDSLQREVAEEAVKLEGIPAQIAMLKRIRKEFLPVLEAAGKEGVDDGFLKLITILTTEIELYYTASLPRKVARMATASKKKRELIMLSASVMAKLDYIVNKYGKREEPGFKEALKLHRQAKSNSRQYKEEKRQYKYNRIERVINITKGYIQSEKKRRKRKKMAKQQAFFDNRYKLPGE